MELVNDLFFTAVQVCKPKVVQGLDLDFNLYLLILLRSAQVSNKMFILSNHILVKLSPLIHQFSANPPSHQKNSLK